MSDKNLEKATTVVNDSGFNATFHKSNESFAYSWSSKRGCYPFNVLNYKV